jgi:stress response protein SCP2
MARMNWTTEQYENCDAKDIDLIMVVLDEQRKAEEAAAKKHA